MECIIGEIELRDYKHKLECLEAARRMSRTGSPQESWAACEIGTVKRLIQAYERNNATVSVSPRWNHRNPADYAARLLTRRQRDGE